jgi:molybdopterin converting factor small subunit
MKVAVRYMAQMKQAAGVAEEQVELAVSCPVRDLLLHLADRQGNPLRNLLLGPDGGPQPTVLIFIGDQQVDLTARLQEGDVVTFLSPIAGGSRA